MKKKNEIKDKLNKLIKTTSGEYYKGYKRALEWVLRHREMRK